MKILAFVCAFAIGAASGPGLAQSADSEPKDIRNSAEAGTGSGLVIGDEQVRLTVSIAEPTPPPAINQDYEPSPPIWILADEDTTIWLFGTFHLLPEGFRWRSPRFDEIVASADELVVETSDSDVVADQTELIALVDEIVSQRRPTSEQLSVAGAMKWKTLIEKAGAPFVLADTLPPLLGLMGISIEFSEALGSTREAGVEAVLEAEFAAAGKRIGSIEDGSAIFRRIVSIDDALIIGWLEEELAQWDGESVGSFVNFEEQPAQDDSDPFYIEHRWAQGFLSDEPMFGDGSFEQLLHELFLEDRNRGWSIWLKDRLERPGNVLVAVGAGHFEEPDSLLTMLKQDGMSVQRIQ